MKTAVDCDQHAMSDLHGYLFEYEQSLHLSEDCPVTPEHRVENYLCGRCHIFALALHQALGLRIGMLVNESSDSRLPCIEHVFCYVSDELIIDARGIYDKEEMYDYYVSDPGETIELSDCKDILMAWMRNKKLERASREEKSHLSHHISQMVACDMLAVAPYDNREEFVTHRLVSILEPPFFTKKIKP